MTVDPPPEQANWHCDPAAVGMDRALIERGLASLARGVAEGRHPGAQVYVSRFGKPVVEYACGWAVPPAAGAPGRPMTPDALLAWFSSCKPVVAMALALLYDRGQVDLDDPVRRTLPEFGAGKEACTLRHVLTHQGGFAGALRHDHRLTWDQAIAAIAAYPAEYAPGTRAGYHPTAGWYVLAEVVRRVDGRPIERFVAEELLQPLGMAESLLGLPEAPGQEQAADRSDGLAHRMAKVALGALPDPARGHFADQAFVDQFNSPQEWGRVNPSGGMRGPARDLGRFYEFLLAQGAAPGQGGAAARPLVDRRTVALFTACHRWDLPDRTLAGAPLPWGLGFILYGNVDVHPSVSRRVYGHSGMVSSVGFADPQRGLVCVVITSGLLDPVSNSRRLREANGPIIAACGG